MENVLIIGGNRFVGKALSERLLHNGIQVDVFNRSGTSSDGAKVIQGDRNKPEDLEKIDFTKYDCIVDMCLFFESQFDLIEHLIPGETNYIFVSSAAANSNYSEHYGDYGHDKKQVERRLQDSKLNYKIVRPSFIVGQGNYRPILSYYMNKIINREHIEIGGNGQNNINIVFVQDVVKHLERLATTPERTYEIIELVGDNIQIIDLIYKVNEYSREGEVLLVQDDENAILPKNDFIFETNWDYTKLDEGLKDYAEWYYKEGAKGYGYNI
ncbi:hypothetical protein N9342_01685 [Candidatus Marinimicrobia bacterium]|nr:hypothetical protein [Candidatus Neomarinimicrobiota bacterium]